MTQLIVHRPDGSQKTIPHVQSKIQRREDKQNTATAITNRNFVNDLDLQEGEDEIEIRDDDTEFRGPLKNFKWSGTEVRLDIVSFMQYAKEAPPTSSKVSYRETQDSEIVLDAIDGIPDLEVGTIHQVKPNVNILFHHATRALQIRLMRKQSKANVRYNSDKTVDYLRPGHIGSDRTDTVLSPSSQNITKATPQTKGGERTKTHMRVIGNGAASVDVVAPSYTDGDRQRWGRAQFKEVAHLPTLRRYGRLLLDDLSEQWLEVKSTLTDIPDVSLQDTFTVDYPEKNIDNEPLTVAELTEVRDNSGLHYEAKLSNRTFARNHEIEKVKKRVSESMRTGQTTASANTPQLNFGGTVNLPAKKFLDQRITVPMHTTLYVWTVIQEPVDTDVAVKLVKGPANTRKDTNEVLYEQKVSSYESDSPLVEYTTGSHGERLAFRLDNTANEEAQVGASVAYSLEAVPRNV